MNYSLQHTSAMFVIQRLLITVLSSSEENRNVKDATTLLSILNTLTQCVSRDGGAGNTLLVEVQDWLLTLCKEQTIGEY